MTSRNRDRQRSNRAVKRGNLWLPFSTLANTTVSSGTLSINTLLDRYLADHGSELPVGSTLGPIRGNFHFHSVTIANQPVIFAAMYLVPEGGLSALPSLNLEQVDAMWYTTQSLNGEVTETAAGVFDVVAMQTPIQTKAMRKITEIGEELAIQVSEVAGDGNVLWDAHGHIFIKLP